jgi:AcrR family transcriptional regulator
VTTEIPRTLQVLWGEPGPARRAQALSLDRIVAAAIDLADADGITALSMARLAERLGSAPMSLYRHVSNKDELLIFMVDAAPGPPPELPTGDWRAGLNAWAHALQGVYYAHPWILQITMGRPPIEPGQLGWLDRGLSTLDGTALSARDRFEAVMTILNYVRGEAQITAVLMRGESVEPVDMRGYGDLIDRFVRPDRFPSLAAAAGAGIFHIPDVPERSFDWGLSRILDGIAALVSAG